MWVKHCFSLVMNGFHNNDGLYSASVSFTEMRLLLSRIKSQSVIAYKNATYKKLCNVVL